jgi:hypothetical protein
MANGIALCPDCKHNVAFKKADAEPAYLRVEVSGVQRMIHQAFGRKNNAVSILDEDQISRASLRVPDAAIDQAGSIKEATQLCEQPEGIRCGAELLLKQMFPDTNKNER